MQVSIDQRSAAEVNKILTQLGKSVNKELAVAVNKTVVQTRTTAARKLKEVIPVLVRVLKKAVFAKDKATAASPRSGINLYGGYPIPLKYFGARQLQKGGVSFRQSGPAKGRGSLPNAFIPPRYGNVYQRAGKSRGPLTQQKGPAPGEYASVGVTAAALATAKDKLPKQIQERVRYLTQKAQGNLK